MVELLIPTCDVAGNSRLKETPVDAPSASRTRFVAVGIGSAFTPKPKLGPVILFHAPLGSSAGPVVVSSLEKSIARVSLIAKTASQMQGSRGRDRKTRQTGRINVKRIGIYGRVYYFASIRAHNKRANIRAGKPKKLTSLA